MQNDNLRQEYDRCRKLINDKLETFFNSKLPQRRLLESMRYSLLAGGKRIRPIITLQFCMAAGGGEEDALEPACAVEMLHTYSLIHDDLPCMDDDPLRRGKPSNHVMFGEFTAVLSGDALQAAAFETLLKSQLPAERVVRMGSILAEAAGAKGMCGGQMLDMQGQGKAPREEALELVHGMKTAELIRAAAVLGVLSAGGSEGQMKAAELYAMSLGLAFQIRDDILDYTVATENLGKLSGSDLVKGKPTFVTGFGIAECERIIHAETKKAVAAVEENFKDSAFLVWLAGTLEERKY